LVEQFGMIKLKWENMTDVKITKRSCNVKEVNPLWSPKGGYEVKMWSRTSCRNAAMFYVQYHWDMLI
jgi:hypothetical protein